MTLDPSPLSRQASVLRGVVFLAAALAFFCSGCAAKPAASPFAGTGSDAAALAAADARDVRDVEAMPVGELLLKGQTALASDNPTLARAYLAAALKKEPNSVEALTGLARAALAEGNHKQARELVDAALAVNPDSVPALLISGRLYRQQGNYESAVAAFSRGLAREPQNPTLLTDLAITYDTDSGSAALAEPLYRKVVEISPDSAAARNNLGFNQLLQGRTDEALRTLSAAANLDPKNPRILNNLATAHLFSGNEAQALQLFRRVLGEAEAYNNIGFLYLSQKQWEKAEAAFNRALELNPRYYQRASRNLETLRQARAKDEAVRLMPSLPR